MPTTDKGKIAGLCIVGAIIVAASGNEGWGWLLALAALVLV